MRGGWYSAWTFDDRGERVALVMCNITLLPLPIGPLPREIQVRIRDQLKTDVASFRDKGSWRIVCVMAALLAPALLFSTAWMFLNRRQFLQPALSFAPMFVAMACIPWVFRWAGSWTLPDRLRVKFAREVCNAGYCASCGHFLDDLPAQADGLTVCPECGGAWKMMQTSVAVTV